jgi:hypothetical protein
MVAKTKRTLGVHEILKRHIAMSKEREGLLEKTQELQAGGKIREARKTFKAAEKVNARIEAFETYYRPRNPHASADD